MDYLDLPEFPALSAACLVPGTETAQRIVASAYDSVGDLAWWHHSAFNLSLDDADEDPELASRTRQSAEDMLRSMVVFAGAGIDAVMKQLVRDTLDLVVARSDTASKKLHRFVEAKLDLAAGSAKSLATYLLSPNPRVALTEAYVRELTGASLQSVEELIRTMSALGVEDRQLLQDCKALKPLFIARNQIVHELDLVHVNTPGDRQRRGRGMEEVVGLSHAGLEFCQVVINAVGAIIAEPEAGAV